MESMHDLRIRTTLFYVFTGAFVIILALTIGSVFFGLGRPSESERSTLFYTFVVEIGFAVAALFYLVFGIKKTADVTNAQDTAKHIEQSLARLGEKIDVLAHDIEFACKVLNIQRYGGLKFHSGDFRKLWKHFAYQPESEFLVLSYIHAREWTDEYAQRILVPTKSRIETDKIRAHRVFAVDSQEELGTLSKIIELHIQYGVPVCYVYVDKLVEKGVCKKPLDYSFILIDNNTLVLFHLLEDRSISYFEVITDTQEINAYRQKFQRIESLSTTAQCLTST